MNDLFNLKDKVAIVTGGSRGLGKAMALGLANAGANVVVASRKLDSVQEVAKEIEAGGGTALAVEVDVSKKETVVTMVKKVIDEFGKIDILVNNAGVFRGGVTEEISEDDWDFILDINLKGQLFCAQEVAKHMIKQNFGKIINISSIAGKLAFNQATAYNASKAGIILMTKSMAVEWGKHNIQVNAICPGVFHTAMTDDFLKDKQFVDMIKTKVPLGRHANPEELQGAVIYLASKASDYVTGHSLVVDGGWIAGL